MSVPGLNEVRARVTKVIAGWLRVERGWLRVMQGHVYIRVMYIYTQPTYDEAATFLTTSMMGLYVLGLCLLLNLNPGKALCRQGLSNDAAELRPH